MGKQTMENMAHYITSDNASEEVHRKGEMQSKTYRPRYNSMKRRGDNKEMHQIKSKLR